MTHGLILDSALVEHDGKFRVIPNDRKGWADYVEETNPQGGADADALIAHIETRGGVHRDHEDRLGITSWYIGSREGCEAARLSYEHHRATGRWSR